MRFSLSLCALPLAAVLITAPAPVRADVIELRADLWCPYNCEPDSKRPGYMIEIAREALAPFGHDVRYRTLNWLRSIDKARRNEVQGIVGAVEREAPDFVFGPALGPLADGIVMRKGDEIALDEPDPFEGMRVGAIRGYEYHGPLAAYIERHKDDRSRVQFAHGDDALLKNLRKLSAGRIDVVAEDMNVIRHQVAAERLRGLAVHSLDVPEPGFVAFSPANPESKRYAREMTEGVERLRRSGRLAEIMAAYGLPVWK